MRHPLFISSLRPVMRRIYALRVGLPEEFKKLLVFIKLLILLSHLGIKIKGCVSVIDGCKKIKYTDLMTAQRKRFCFGLKRYNYGYSKYSDYRTR